MPTTFTGKQIRDETVTLDDIGPEAEEQFSKVKVSSGDTTTDYLSNKVVAGTNITVNTINSGSYETLAVSGSVFGMELFYTQSLGATTFQDSEFLNKISGSTAIIPAGDYRLGWSYNWNGEQGSVDFESRILVDGVSIGNTNATSIHRERNNNVGGDSYPVSSSSNSNQALLVSGFEYLTFASDSSHSIQLQVGHNNSKKITIWNAKIEMWRVS